MRAETVEVGMTMAVNWKYVWIVSFFYEMLEVSFGPMKLSRDGKIS